MPVSIDIHENEFLEEIYQEGLEKGAAPFREILLDVLDQRFGTLSPDTRQRIRTADLAMIQAWTRKLLGPATTLDQIFQ